MSSHHFTWDLPTSTDFPLTPNLLQQPCNCCEWWVFSHYCLSISPSSTLITVFIFFNPLHAAVHFLKQQSNVARLTASWGSNWQAGQRCRYGAGFLSGCLVMRTGGTRRNECGNYAALWATAPWWILSLNYGAYYSQHAATLTMAVLLCVCVCVLWAVMCFTTLELTIPHRPLCLCVFVWETESVLTVFSIVPFPHGCHYAVKIPEA